MSTPCVLYFSTQKVGGFSESFHGYTPRKEKIWGLIIQHYVVDPAKIYLHIDGVNIDSPDNLGYVDARKWVIEQIQYLLGYHVIDMKD